MTSAGWATLDVIPSFKGFRSALDKGVSGDMATVGRTSGAKFGDQAGKAAGGRFKSKFTEGLKGMAGPVAGIFAGAAIVDTFKDAITGASDLAESGNKIQAVFGEATARVTGFASDAANAFGQTRVQALDAAATFGTFGKAAGLSGGELAGFSEKMVGLSSDLASFYNTDPSQAIEAIGAALRGESEPIRSYGVLLDDATLRQEAMRQGLIQTTKQALTPQQKVLAAYQVILKQTSDAQGDFGRTSGGLANQQRILSAQWSEMKTNLGTQLLPVAVGFAHTMNDDVLPAIKSVGGVASDAASAFGSLPTPVKAAAGAFVVLRIAAAAGLTATAASGVASMGTAMTDLRLRTLLAADAFKSARTGSIQFTGNVGKVTPSMGRFASSLDAVKTGAQGAGGALRKGLGGAMSLLGGPWGLAIGGATVAVTYFWQEHQKAKQFVDDLTGSLNDQTGALTKNSIELIQNQLASKGWLDYADKLGISLDTVRSAAMGNADALAEVQRQVAAQKGGGLNPFNSDNWTGDSGQFIQALKDSSAAIDDAKGKQDQFNRFSKDGATATGNNAQANDTAAGSFKGLADRITDAKNAVQGLAAAEQKRKDARVAERRDALALIEAQQAARKEARKGKQTLDEQTKAGQANWHALLDLADQWNTTDGKVRNARGAYKDMRQTFIDVAKEMGASDTKAKNLADRLLKLPKRKRIDVDTPGMEKALDDLRKLKERVKSAGALSVYVNSHQAGDPRLGNNANGTDFWRGGPTWVGERGPEILNLPRGSQVIPNDKAAAGVNVQIGTVVAQDYRDFMTQMQRRSRSANGGGVSF